MGPTLQHNMPQRGLQLQMEPCHANCLDNLANGKDLIAAAVEEGAKFTGCKEEFLPCTFHGRVVSQVAILCFLHTSHFTFSFHISLSHPHPDL